MGRKSWRAALIAAFVIFCSQFLSCSLFATRPVQQMSYSLAAIKAAKEVKADTYAPELFRLANEWFFEAKNEYKYKNFKLAREYAIKARKFAEQAEFEAIRSGAERNDESDVSDTPEVVKDKPYEYPQAAPIPASDYSARTAPATQ